MQYTQNQKHWEKNGMKLLSLTVLKVFSSKTTWLSHFLTPDEFYKKIMSDFVVPVCSTL